MQRKTTLKRAEYKSALRALQAEQSIGHVEAVRRHRFVARQLAAQQSRLGGEPRLKAKLAFLIHARLVRRCQLPHIRLQRATLESPTPIAQR
jgi:hypothetical protein